MNLNNLIFAAIAALVVEGVMMGNVVGENGKSVAQKIIATQQLLYSPIANCTDPLSGECEIKIPREVLSMR